MTHTTRLLIVEEDRTLAGLLQSVLSAEGHPVDVADSAEEGLGLALRTGYAAILIDLVLRNDGGAELLRRLRQEGVMTPILVLEGGAGTAGVVRALDAGADEYMTRPVSVEEVATRVRALVRRGTPPPPLVLTAENVALNVVTHQASVGQRHLRLTPKEFALLHCFMRRRGELISRTELLEKVWETRVDPGSNVVDVHVSRLRGKLERAGARLAIEAARGVGFRLVSRPAPDGRRSGAA